MWERIITAGFRYEDGRGKIQGKAMKGRGGKEC